MLKDFPETLADAEALVKHGIQKLHGIYLIEELFVRDLDDDNEEELVLRQTTQSQMAKVSDRAGSPNPEAAEEAEASEVKPKEKLINVLAERAQVFNDVIQINRLFKK